MATQQVSSAGHADEYARQQQVVARGGPVQQHGIGTLVDEKTAGGDAEESKPCAADGPAMAAETELVMPGERHAQRHQPADHVGLQRCPAAQGNQGSGHAPVHGGRGATDHDEPTNAATLPMAAGRDGVGAARSKHEAPQHSSWRRISLCVDDYGLHAGINQAVLALVHQGRVQAVSAMVGGPAWTSGAPALRALDPRQLEVGLHLDLTECPLQPALRRPLGPLIAMAYLRRLDSRALRIEICAQFDAFEQAMGRAPAYVDGHQHVHQLPMVRTLLLQELARRYPAGGLWLRATHSPQCAAHADVRTRFKSHVIASLGATALSALARRQGLRQNARLLGVYDFAGGAQRYRARVQRWLHAARDGDLLMCHAGLPTSAPDGLTAARQDEFAVLSAPEFEDALAAARVRLQPMGQILVELLPNL